jgi:predicted dienelactone hydrolase
MYAAFAQAAKTGKNISLNKKMRPLEIIIPILLAIYLLWPFVTRHGHPMVIKLLPPLTLLLTITHLVFEGYRWQMIPLYVLTAAIALVNLPTLLKVDSANEPPRGWRAAASYLTLILVAVSTAVPALLPVPRVAAPSGPYQVGTQTIVLTDASRRELYSGRDEPRKFMIQVWYPAAPRSSDVHAPWMENADIFAPAIAKQINLPGFFLNHLALSKSPAFKDAPLATAEKGYPVIVFSHGWSGFAAQNSAQMVELASQGYVVVGMQHTYGAVVTVFPDGQVAPLNPNALPDSMPEPGYTDVARLLVNQWAGDISYALDYLTEQNADAASPFHAALDLTRVGVYGHSTGGGATIQFCGTDARCKAALTQDPFMTPVSQEVQEGGLRQPLLVFFSQGWRDLTDSKNNRLFDAFLPNVTTPVGVATIIGTLHYDFTDIPLLSPLAPQLGLKGDINGKLVVKILNDYLVAYFNQELKGIPSPIPFGSSADYPDLRWESQ